jgi:hypothetical protein
MKLYFISQPSSKSTLPFAGLQHMQQCHVNFHSIFAPGFWSKWMVPEKWSPQWGFEPTTSKSWVFCLNHLTMATRLHEFVYHSLDAKCCFIILLQYKFISLVCVFSLLCYSPILANTRQIRVLLQDITKNVLFHLVRLAKVRWRTLSCFFGECLWKFVNKTGIR